MEHAGSLAEELLAQSPACHLIVDANGIILRVFGDTESICGKAVSSLEGQAIAECFGPERSGSWKQRLERAFAGESLTLRERTEDTNWNISVFPIRMEGETRYAGVMAREVTPWVTAEQELRHTVLGALKAMEFERSVASRFLHDSVGQALTAAGLQLDLVRMDLESISPETCERVAEIQKVLEEMMESVREYSYTLNPSTVERAGLRPALDRLIARVRERFNGVFRVNVDPSLKLPPRVASSMFHIAQEAVENAVQHASCSSIEIAVKSTRTSSFLEIRDNGRGFDPSDLQQGGRGLGLLSMEHYAAEAGLELSIMSSREKGTTVRAAAADKP